MSTTSPSDSGPRAPIVVIGVGNRLLHDDGVGLVLLERLAEAVGPLDDVEFLDGGTQGLALLGFLEQRSAVLFLDAVGAGAAPGTVHAIADPTLRRPSRAGSAHEGNVRELLSVAALLGQLPERVVIVGIEPAVVRTGIGLSPEADGAVDAALAEARQRLEAMRRIVSEALHA